MELPRADTSRTAWRAVSVIEVASAPAEVAQWIGDPRRLNDLTPGWFHLRVEAGLPADPIRELRAGDVVRYSLRLGPVRMPWESVIETWDYAARFSYHQGRGPFKHFRHDHVLEPTTPGTRLTDVLEYAVPGGTPVHTALVLPMLKRIFAVRRWRLLEVLGAG